MCASVFFFLMLTKVFFYFIFFLDRQCVSQINKNKTVYESYRYIFIGTMSLMILLGKHLPQSQT